MVPLLSLAFVLTVGSGAQTFDSASLRARMGQAVRYRQADQPATALELFNKILVSQPAYLPALEGAAEAAYSSRSPLAASLLNRVLAQLPTEPSANAMAAVLHFEAGDCPQAVSHFELSRAAFADRLDFPLRYASCLIELNRTSDAIETLSALSTRWPGNPIVRFDLALACSLVKQDERVVDLLLEASGTPSGDEESQILLAGSLARLHRQSEAVNRLRQAAARQPGSLPLMAALVNILLTANRPKEALAYSEIAVTQMPRQAAPYVLRGAAFAETGQDALAQLDFDRAAQMESNSAEGSTAKGVFLLERAAPEEAAQYLRARLENNPGSPQLSYLLAKALDRGEHSPASQREALSLLRACLSANHEMADAQALLGKLYLEQADLPRARTALETALALDPANRPALNRLLHLYRELGLTAEAAQLTVRLRQSVSALSAPANQVRLPE